jgi:hypothetical protein
MRKNLWVILAVLVTCLPCVAQAQENEADALNMSLNEIQWEDEGLNPDVPEHWPRMVQIAHAYGYMTDVTDQQVEVAVYASKDLKRVGGRIVNVQSDWCSTTDAKARALDRMNRAFTYMSWAFGAAAAWAAANRMQLPPGTTRTAGIALSGILAAGTAVTGISATASAWLADMYRQAYRNYNCAKGAGEWFRPLAPRLLTVVHPVWWQRPLCQA